MSAPGTNPKKEAENAVDKVQAADRTPFGTVAPWSEPAPVNNLNSPYYNESHRRLRAYARSFMDKHIIPDSLSWEAAGDVPHSTRLLYARAGLAFNDVPAAYRPSWAQTIGDTGIKVTELDIFHLLVLVDETSRVEGGVTGALGGGSAIGVPPIVAHGTEAQKRAWLPGLFTWETAFCLGITEPSGGSDVGNIRTTAVKTPDGRHYIVNGHKKWITGSPWATHMTTAVRTGDEGSGIGGVSLLVIPLKGDPGVSIKKIYNSGQNAGGSSWVSLENVKVPVENLLGKENRGFQLIMTNFNKERFVMAAACNRKSRTCLNDALAYAHDRETFGQPLIAHQIIRHKLTEMARRIESHWAWLEQVAYHIHTSPRDWQDPDVAGRIALLKVSGGKMLEFCAREAQQILGGVGYQKGGVGGHVEQINRDLRMMVVGGGSEEIIGDLAYREELKLAKKRGSKI